MWIPIRGGKNKEPFQNPIALIMLHVVDSLEFINWKFTLGKS